MTVRDLDRLISRTSMNPISKKALKGVRRALLSGSINEPTIGRASWSVEVQTQGNYPARMIFSFRRN